MTAKKILHYEILEKLGEGGMGIVYLAEDSKLDRKVAIKFLPRHVAADMKQRRRFQSEAKAAAALNHPNIATIHAIEEYEDDMFIVMEYIEGQELKKRIQKTALPVEQIIEIFRKILSGIKDAHAKGIIHRDIKSSNIMITEDDQIKIMDFGLAKVRGSAQVTQIGSTLGTLAYMAPEQVRGEQVDEHADIWSVGVVLYELCTGQLPFGGDYEQVVMYSILHDDFKPVSEFNPDIPASLEIIVNKCLQKPVEQRYQTIKDVIRDLKTSFGITDTGSHILQDGLKPAPSGQRRKLHYTLAGISLIVIVAALFFSGTSIFKNWFAYAAFPQEQHLMVLPITKIGGDQNDQALCDGLVETLTSKLSQLEKYHGSLWVVPSSEVHRSKISSPSMAHQLFEVNLAITGSLQSINDSYRLTINLVDAENLRQLNSSVIDMNKSNVAALQDRSVFKLVDMLNLQLNPETEQVLQGGGSTIPGSYEFYLQARGYLLRYEDEANLNLAIDLFKSAITKDSLFVLARAGLAEAYWRKYENSKDPLLAENARLEGQRAFEMNNTLAQVNITLGMIYSGTGQYEDAVTNFKRAVNEEPTNSDAYRGLAQAYEAQNLLDDAEATYKKAITLKPDYWAGYNSLGAFYFRYSRYEDAISQFNQVVKLTPDNYRGYNNLGGMYYALERWTEAREMFEQSLALKESYGVSSNLGTLYFIEGDYKNAAKMYEKALSINDNDYRIWGNLASAYQWIPGKHKESIENYKIAIEKARERMRINPNDVNTHASLAGYYAMTGDREQAKLLVAKSLEMAPDNLDIMYQAATTFEQLGEREKAINWLMRALEGGYSYSEIVNQPELKQLLADDRFKTLQKKETK